MKRKNLIKFRIDKNLKSYEMAKKLNLTAPYYSNLENGKIINPKESIARRLEKEFEIDNGLYLLELVQ